METTRRTRIASQQDRHSIFWADGLHFLGCAGSGLCPHKLSLYSRALNAIFTDNCCHCAAHDSPPAGRRKELQLGGNVSLPQLPHNPSHPLTSSSAYLLAAASLGTVYGKISDIVGSWTHNERAYSALLLTVRGH